MSSDALRRRFPALRLSDAPGDLENYGRDWTRLVEPAPSAVVFPERTEQVVELVRWARETSTALVPSGGRTGLSGGAVAARGEVVVSFERMHRVLEFEPVDRLLTVEAGMVTEAIQTFAAERGLCYPVDFAARGSSQIGGNVATNAGGIRVLRHGLTREHVAGLTVVTGVGEVLELNRGLVKNATGYDLRHLFIGSEGTLGLITAVTLELTDPPPPQAVLLLAAPDMRAVMAIFQEARRRLRLSAFEFFSDNALERVLQRHALRAPIADRASYYALAEFDCPDEAAEAQAVAVFEAALEAGWTTDGIISQSEAQAAELWALREHITESIAPETPYKNDISVRVSRVADFLAALDALVAERYPDFELVWFGHIGDGNLHLNILKPAALALPAFRRRCETVNEAVFELVADFGGSISAEHGVGLLKQPYLERSRSGAEIELMRALKGVFDPDGILNPGKLI